jgi:hypothetical protein
MWISAVASLGLASLAVAQVPPDYGIDFVTVRSPENGAFTAPPQAISPFDIPVAIMDE